MASGQMLVTLSDVILWSIKIVKSEFWIIKDNVRLTWFRVTTNKSITKKKG